MPTLAQITRNLAPATLGSGEDAVNMHYYPLRITTDHIRLYGDLAVLQETLPKRLAKYEAMPDSAEAATAALDETLSPLEAVAGALVDILADWDLTHEKDGPAVPIEPESLRALGFGVLAATFTAIMTARSSGLGKANGMISSVPTSATPTRAAASTNSRTAGASRKKSR